MKYFILAIFLTGVLGLSYLPAVFAPPAENQTYAPPFTTKDRPYQSPLQQFKEGIAAENVQCGINHELVIKQDGFPACVRPETKIRLIELGWANPCLGDVIFGCQSHEFYNNIDGVSLQLRKAELINGQYSYSNDHIAVPKGHMIMWDNIDKVAHTITTKNQTGGFDSGQIPPRSIFVLDTSRLSAGYYDYYDKFNKTLTGSIRVTQYDSSVEKELIERTKDLQETKLFLAKYPEALVFLQREYHDIVTYELEKQVYIPHGIDAGKRVLRLYIVFDRDHQISRISVECGGPISLQTEGVIQYIKGESCLKPNPRTTNSKIMIPDTVKEISNEGRVTLYPSGNCASISVERFSPSELEQRQARSAEELKFLKISEEDLQKVPILLQLIEATQYIYFPPTDSAFSEMSALELVEHEKYLVKKATEKYNDTEEDYFIKLDPDIGQKLDNPKKEGFSNEFLAPMIVYKGEVYAIGHTVFWVADEHQPVGISIHIKDSTGDKKFVILSDLDMRFLPKIKEAIDEIGKNTESVVAIKGIPEPEWNEYREWFESKTLEQFRNQKDPTHLFVYGGEHYEAGFPIC